MSNSILFSGNSRYASDFQQIIERAVAIASLPISQLNSQKTVLNDQAAALRGVEAAFTGLQSALDALNSAGSGGYHEVALSDSSVARAELSGAVLPGTYGVEVVSLGAHTNAMSSDGLPTVSDAFTQSLSASSHFTLTVDGVSYDIDPTANTLTSLAQALNTAGAGLQATVVNIGSSNAPDYRLFVQTEKLGASSIQLNDGDSDLLDIQTTGSPAAYRVNGQPASAIESASRTVVIAPGLIVDLLKQGSTSITIENSGAGIAEALASFVTAFNASVDELDKHRGEGTGALKGQSVVYSLAQSLRQIGGYNAGSGSLASLASMGISFDRNGRLSFDQAAFQSASAEFPEMLAFLGGTESGGFLKAAQDVMKTAVDANSGVMTLAAGAMSRQIAEQDKLIAANQLRVELLRETLNAKMAAADALIASLEQQVAYMSGLFEAMKGSDDR